MEAIQEDLTAALDNKNPSIRSETALFMARAFARTNPALINKKLLKVFVTSLLKVFLHNTPVALPKLTCLFLPTDTGRL